LRAQIASLDLSHARKYACFLDCRRNRSATPLLRTAVLTQKFKRLKWRSASWTAVAVTPLSNMDAARSFRFSQLNKPFSKAASRSACRRAPGRIAFVPKTIANAPENSACRRLEFVRKIR